MRARAWGTALVLCMLVPVLAACERVVTHEPRSSYDAVQTGGDATYGTSTAGPPAYQGAAKARASYGGTGSPATAHAYGEIGARNLDTEGTYGAAFYFPAGTFSGSSPSQTGTLDIMRWYDGANHGGVRVGTDHRAELVTAAGTEVEANKQFVLREECWNWVVVRQKLSTADGAGGELLNEVFVNGERVASSTKKNTSAAIADGGVDGVRFGLVEMGSGQAGPLTFYADDAHVSTETTPRPPATGAALCKPLPNILFIVTDDQREGTIGDPDPAVDSPNDPDSNPANDYWMPKTMKWFQQGDSNVIGGTRFQNTVATTPLCCPARSSIFTGRYAHNHGVTQNEHADDLDQATTLQSFLRNPARAEVPYDTAVFGKFLSGWDLTQNPPNWDRWAVYNSGVHTPVSEAGSCRHPDDVQTGPIFTRRGLNCINENGTLRGWPYAPSPYPQYESGYLRDQALAYIDEREANDEQPWFMYLAPTLPHSPLDPEPGVYDAPNGPTPPPFPDPEPENFLEPDLTGKPPYVLASASALDRETRKATALDERDKQLRMLRSVDDMVDAVFTKLKESGEEKDTLAFFISDNGYQWGEHWRFKKKAPYTDAVRVPLLARWPGRVPANAVDTRLAANIDLAPTALKAAGGSSAAPMDGRDLFGPPARNRWLTESWHETDPRPATDAPDWAALTTPPPPPGDATTPYYRYIEYYDDDSGAITFREYYDLRTDPLELNNLYGADGDPAGDPPTQPTAAALSNVLSGDRGCSGAGCP